MWCWREERHDEAEGSLCSPNARSSHPSAPVRRDAPCTTRKALAWEKTRLGASRVGWVKHCAQ
ncbi:MAG: hypothetical protein OJF50_000865 [Nitrospira sp.]|nr:hypothetical protein [Nitrospira sp.]